MFPPLDPPRNLRLQHSFRKLACIYPRAAPEGVNMSAILKIYVHNLNKQYLKLTTHLLKKYLLGSCFSPIAIHTIFDAQNCHPANLDIK